MRLLKLIPDNTNIAFLSWRRPFFIVSLLLMAASVALVATKGLNLGVDFVGGQMIRATFVGQTEAPIPDIREKIGALGFGEPTIQRFGQPNEISIRMKLPEVARDEAGAANRMTERVLTALKTEFPGVRIDGVDSVSGKVSAELFKTGAIALIAAMLAISLFIWIRFEWQFGVGALYALLHDVTLTFGMFSLTQMEFDLNIVAALLTIIGYSLNDTIIVYDRIRENLKKYRKMEIGALLDLSVNETLSRTVMTNVAMLGTLIVLLLLGPGSIFGFTAAMTLGIFVGTYSSIYMAAPILIWLKVTPNSFLPAGDPNSKVERVAPEAGEDA